jgi:hypothetical protein
MLKFGADYIDKGIEAYEFRYRQHQTKWLTKQAAALNLQLIPAPTFTAEFLETFCVTSGDKRN